MKIRFWIAAALMLCGPAYAETPIDPAVVAEDGNKKTEAAEAPDGSGGREETLKRLDAASRSIRDAEKAAAAWAALKDEHKRILSGALERLEARIEEMQDALDHGEPELRAKINEAIFDLKRQRDDIKQVADQLTATLAVRLANVKNDIDDAVEDFAD